MPDQDYNGIILEDKWGKTYLCSNCLFAYADLGQSPITELKDNIYGRYFLHDLEPATEQRSIWAKMYQQARPSQFDLSRYTNLQLRDSLIDIFSNNEMWVWPLSDGWGQQPEGIGIGDGGLAPVASSGSSAPPVANPALPRGGGVVAVDNAPAKRAEHNVRVAATDISDNSLKSLTKNDINIAKSEGDSKLHIHAREKVAKDFLEKNGFTESQIANAIGDEKAGIEGGIDFTRPVEVISFPPPEEMSQYVKSHGFPGNWFDPLSTQTPNQLGLSGEGRKATSFKVPKSQGLQSHSKPIIDNWTNPSNPVNTSGGGIQLFINDDTKKAVISINKVGI
ncbi:polymorphic toxin type 46 domain-containing protein [Rheinheimera salexigens]|uniref:Bacterial toxin 46 domain-containing protein n=1 Tax=Rheinheimera salexigens TaxID=1628148 RepID=A0A1E7Q5I0_9GAMM|nr:polymorphic toxin type 46 domain-containing protein [Rheinheimera salexigens]OEY69407.1 hypothetical protein BI198_07390 [Rheinheimera salexigens]